MTVISRSRGSILMKVKNAAIAGVVSLAAAAALSSPAYAATQYHNPNAPAHLRSNGCTLSVTDRHPYPREWETLTVQTDAGRSVVDVQINYRTVSHLWTIITNKYGVGNHTFNVGHPTRRYRVTLFGKVVRSPRGYRTGATCYTSFTPR
jgi:hypothetical protein